MIHATEHLLVQLEHYLMTSAGICHLSKFNLALYQPNSGVLYLIYLPK